jgi:hypothetical protein
MIIWTLLLDTNLLFLNGKVNKVSVAGVPMMPAFNHLSQ